MQTGPEMLRAYAQQHGVVWADFVEWAQDAQIPEEELNHHDSRSLAWLERYVEEMKEEEA